ncbi:MAG: DMT family transporter [Candidatus Bathyarchaeota archaeon]|nr:DMT family transporter [Candidatus Bathyarchaeota archaeon]
MESFKKSLLQELTKKVKLVGKNRFGAETRRKAILFTVLAGLLWGTSFPLIKTGLMQIEPLTFVFLRFLIATLTVFSVMVVTKNVSFSFNNKRLIVFLGIINGVAYLLQYVGMVYTFAFASSLFVNLSVVWVGLLSPMILKEHLGGKKVAGVLFSLLGVVLMTTNLDFESLNTIDITGNFLVIIAGILWAVFIIYNKPLVEKTNNLIQSMTWILLFTMIPLLPTATSSIENAFTLPWNAWLIIFYTAILCWVVPYYFWLKGLKHISPVTSAIVLLTEIIVAIAISIIFLGEILTLISGIGAAFIIIAIFLVS